MRPLRSAACVTPQGPRRLGRPSWRARLAGTSLLTLTALVPLRLAAQADNRMNLQPNDPAVQALLRLQSQLPGGEALRQQMALSSAASGTAGVQNAMGQAWGNTSQAIGAVGEAITLANRLMDLLQKLGVRGTGEKGRISQDINSTAARLQSGSDRAVAGMNGVNALIAFIDGSRALMQSGAASCQFSEVLRLGDNAFRAGYSLKRVISGNPLEQKDGDVRAQNYLSYILGRYQVHNGDQEAQFKARQLVSKLDQGCNTTITLHQLRRQRGMRVAAQIGIDYAMPMFERWAAMSIADTRDTILPGLVEKDSAGVSRKARETDDSLMTGAGRVALNNLALETEDVAELHSVQATTDAATRTASDITSALLSTGDDIARLRMELLVLAKPGWDSVPPRTGPTLRTMKRQIEGREVTFYYRLQTCPEGYPDPENIPPGQPQLPTIMRNGIPAPVCGLASPTMANRVRPQAKALRANLQTFALVAEPRLIEVENAILTQDLNQAKRTDRGRLKALIR